MKHAWIKSWAGALVLGAVLAGVPARGLEDGLARTPPMGWNSWNAFRCEVSDALLREIADALVTTGLRDAGYTYLVIDDCWQVDRDPEGYLIADPARFPQGMKPLADYIHGKGLKFGIYSDAGTATCQGRPGSRGYEFQDARLFAEWGVDYLKYDWCNHGRQDAYSSYAIMRDALKKAGRPVVFSICEWGTNRPWEWAPEVGHLWRIWGDIRPHWDVTGDRATTGIMQIVDYISENKLHEYAGPGRWNDPDMLEVGNPGMSLSESRAHFSLWCIFAAPLMAGNDLRSVRPEVLEILTNREAIAVDQDPLGQQGYRFRDFGDTEIWRRWLSPAADGRRRDAFVLLNRAETAKEMTLYLDPQAEARDVWGQRDLGRFANGEFRAVVPPHDAVMLVVTGLPFRN